jgi:hypothetical protein
MTKDNANAIGFWLKTPGGEDGCGEAEAYASELPPDQAYQILLLADVPQGKSKPVGRFAEFTLTPALPH